MTVAGQRLSRRAVVAGATAATLLAGGLSAVSCFQDVRRARERLAGRSRILRTSAGRLEYAVAGNGSPLLMIHGTGGGFDQGLGFGAGLIERGHHVIAPSRFGYLRSDFPLDHSSERQADVLVELLDHLGIDKLPVAGGSAGALAAVQMALRHPDRCSALVLLVPAANVGGRDPVVMSPLTEFAVRRLLESDFLYWTALKLVPNRLVGTLLATDPQLLPQVSAAERERARRILEELLPIGERSRGMLNDARLAGHPALTDFTRIRVPTLVVSVEDDRFGTAATAREIAAKVPNCRLVIYPSGGHIWLGHDAEVADEVHEFLASPSSLSPPRRAASA